MDFVFESVICPTSLGLAMSAAAIVFVPGHFGVPLGDLHAATGSAFALLGGFVVASNRTSVVPPAFLPRQEVSDAVAKDLSAALVRINVLVPPDRDGRRRPVPVVVQLRRGRRGPRRDPDLPASAQWGPTAPVWKLCQVRARLRSVLGSHSAALGAVVPSAVLLSIVTAVNGATTAAFVGVPLVVAAYITVIPPKSSQALLAELADPTRDAGAIAAAALRRCYTNTLPAAVLLGGLAPLAMHVFGDRYAAYGSWYLRWDAAAALVATFIYVSDTVLLARAKVAAYNAVSILGSVLVLGSYVAAAFLGALWYGPAALCGQLLYLAISVAAVRISVLRRGPRQALPVWRGPHAG